MPDTLFAFTALEPTYPAFINISRLDDGGVRVTIRSEHLPAGSSTPHPLPGPIAEITLTADQVESLALALRA